MKRLIDYHLLEWKKREFHKPLLLRGARQVGKTYAVRELGKTFKTFVEVNFEGNAIARDIFEKELDPAVIVPKLSSLFGVAITSGSTLLFLDEIQVVPNAIIALRYFYEKMPGLHVIAAGSLLDFAIEQVGVPVGRVSFLYMYPVSFLEFLVARGYSSWARAILTTGDQESVIEVIHEKLLDELGIYLAIGGMPEAVDVYLRKQDPNSFKEVQSELLVGYQQDFGRYAKKHQIKYLDLVFRRAVEQLSKKFMYSRVGEYQKRELEPALELLEKAGLFYRVLRTAGQGIPLGAQADIGDFKIIFVDVGLTQAILSLDSSPWIFDPFTMFVNRGELVEAFVGQELLAYSTGAISRDRLFYWRKDQKGNDAEIDYLVQLGGDVIPVEVKSSKSRHMKSMHRFLDSHQKTPYGIRLSTEKYEVHTNTSQKRIYSYPLYAVIKPLLVFSSDTRKAVESLVEEKSI